MFESLVARVELRAAGIARSRAGGAAGRMTQRMQPDIVVTAVDGGVELSGVGLRHRWVLDPAFRDAVREGWS
jgi:hypothetical protein